MKEVILALIEKVLGNEKILIVFCVTVILCYGIFMFKESPDVARDMVNVGLGGILGMAVSKGVEKIKEEVK